MLSVLVYIYTVVISSHRPKRFSADLAAGHSHSKESFNSPLRLSATPRSHRQSIPLLFGSPVIERNDCWVRIAFVEDICINRLIPIPTRFNFPSYRNNTCQTVKMKPIVSAMNAWSWYAICYTALLFWKFCGLRCWPAILVIHTASSSRYLPSSSSQSLDHYTRFDSFPLRWPRFILLST